MTTSLQARLHWLPVHCRIDFKMLMLVFKSLNGLALSYLSDLLTKNTANRSLRSADKLLLIVPGSRLHRADRAFVTAAPKLRISPPLQIIISPTLDIFKACLKTHFYSLAFNHD